MVALESVIAKGGIKVLKNLLVIVILFGLTSWGIFSYLTKDVKHATEEQSKPAVSEVNTDSLKTGIEEGNIAPDFQLTTIDGKSMKLSEQRGKKVFLNFWATWCPPCRAEMPDMENFYKDQKNNSFVILAVNYTTQEKNKDDVQRFVEDFGLTFPILLDLDGSISSHYQIFTIPTTFVIDSNGVIQKKIVGPLNKEMMEKLVSSIK